MSKPINACTYRGNTCPSFDNINKDIISLVNDHYFNLQTYANYIFGFDNQNIPLATNNNIDTEILDILNNYNFKKLKMKNLIVFDPKDMIEMEKMTVSISNRMESIVVTSKKYLSELDNIHVFASGAASSTIILKADRIAEGKRIPIIIKITPLEMPHHYPYIGDKSISTDIEKNEFISRYVKAPAAAIFFKEAWMYCFTKNHIAKYTPTFTCISNCYITQGLPIPLTQNILDEYLDYVDRKYKKSNNVIYKRWFNYLFDTKIDLAIKQQIVDSHYGVFEMTEIAGTLSDFITTNKLSVGMIFEYLYSKMVCAYIGRIIFTDDHFGNVGYMPVNYIRHYKIKCNGCVHDFYAKDRYMVQFIDLERYIFNYTPYDVFTNDAVQATDIDLSTSSESFKSMVNDYKNNPGIMDKTILGLKGNMDFINFESENDKMIISNILNNPLMPDVRSFAQIMENCLPENMKETPYPGVPVQTYEIDLDDDSIRVIKFDDVQKQLE